jgi:hypothetical protein
MITIILLIYIFGIFGAYMFMQTAHSKGGKWDNLDVVIDDFFIILVPIINVIITIDWLFGNAKRKDKRSVKVINFNKFFGVKK